MTLLRIKYVNGDAVIRETIFVAIEVIQVQGNCYIVLTELVKSS